MLSTVQLADLAGVTFRQLDKWDRDGLLTPSLRSANGSGTRRYYSADDLRLAVVLKEFSRPFTQGGDMGKRTHKRVRRLITEAFRATPAAPYFVVLNGVTVHPCETVEEAVALTSTAIVSTIIWPERLLRAATANRRIIDTIPS